MSSTVPPKNLTVRLTPELYEAASEIAQQCHISLNALLQESLLQTLRANEEQARYHAYSALGQEIEMCDVEYAIHAQAEVMLHGEPS